MIKLSPILPVLLTLPLTLLRLADAQAESGAAESADLSLAFSPEVANVEPGGSTAVALTLSNDDGYIYNGTIEVTVAVTLPEGVELVAATAPLGTSYDEITDIWRITDLQDYDTRELVLNLRPAATGYSVITAEVATSPVQDPDSWPDDGEVCDDDFARMLLAAGNPDAGVPMAPDCTPPPPLDAGPVPDASTASLDAGPSPDAASHDANPHPGYTDGDAGCAAGGHGSGGYLALVIGLLLVTSRRRRCWAPRESQRPGGGVRSLSHSCRRPTVFRRS